MSIVIKKENEPDGKLNFSDLSEDSEFSKGNRFEQSLAYAKEAINKDFKDGYSWCNSTSLFINYFLTITRGTIPA